MTSLRNFLKPWWTKLILVICLTVLTYASVSETILKLNQQGKGASDLCYGPKTITISGGESGKTLVANAITNYLASSHPSSKFSSMTNPGRVFVDYAASYGVNPLLLFAISEVETGAGTSGSSLSCGNPFGQRIKDANKTSQRWCCTGFAESCSASDRWLVYSSGVSQTIIAEEASFLKTNYLDKGVTTLTAFLADFRSSSPSGYETSYRNLIDKLIASSGTALEACNLSSTTTQSSTTTTSGAKPSCNFNPTSYTVASGGTVSLQYGTTNASGAEICSSGGTCKTVSVGSGKSFSASPTGTTTYTMTVSNALGDKSTCQASVTVNPTTTTMAPAPSCSFGSSSYSGTPGSSLNLKYNTVNAVAASICSSGATCKSGLGVGSGQTYVATPTNPVTYTLTVTNASGKTATCQTTVTMPDPSCAFNPSSYSTSAGSSVNLSYSTYNASSIKICSASGSCKTDLLMGPLKAWVANPTQSTTYTMTVTNPSGASRTCTASVTVN